MSECGGCGRDTETVEIDGTEYCLVCLDGQQETAAEGMSHE